MPPPGDDLLAQQIAYFEERLPKYQLIAGGWPPKLKTREELDEVRAHLLADIQHARDLVADKPKVSRGRELLAELLRMAHNLDVPDAAREAEVLLQQVLRENPESYEANLSIASLYVTSHPDFMPKAESHFHQAIRLRPVEVNPMIYLGLGYATLHQSKINAALDHFRRYLELVPQDAQTRELVARLAAGEVPQSLYVPLNEEGRGKKPWWKFW